jgi:SAM-dependent methyltransferase
MPDSHRERAVPFVHDRQPAVMTDASGAGDREPVTWHHGLVARWWAEVNEPEPGELAFYRAAIERFGQPALDLGCGAGRLLVPLVAAGMDVDGVDVSVDMLERAGEAVAAAGAAREGQLARQAFHDLDRPRRYGTIYCCDSFGIGGSREDDELALRRVLAHLEPGGAFVLTIDVLRPEDEARLADPARVLPMPWPDAGRRARLAGGDELELDSRTADYDAGRRCETMEMRARLWHGDRLLGEEHGRLKFTYYAPDDLSAMLEAAGFGSVVVEGRYTGHPPEPGEETVVVIARRVS